MTASQPRPPQNRGSALHLLFPQNPLLFLFDSCFLPNRLISLDGNCSLQFTPQPPLRPWATSRVPMAKGRVHNHPTTLAPQLVTRMPLPASQRRVNSDRIDESPSRASA